MLKINWYYFLFITNILLWSESQSNSAITLQLKDGRLGDQLWNICKSLMLADTYSLDFIVKPFADSQKFPIHEFISITNNTEKKRVVKVGSNKDIEKNLEKDNILFLTNFYTRPDELLYNYCLKHKQFQQKLIQLFLPHTVEKNYALPTTKITVALHMRKGSKWDLPLSSVQEYTTSVTPIYDLKNEEHIVSSASAEKSGRSSDAKYPLKFPPNQFYIDAIKKLSELVNHQPILIHLFTDHYNPEALVKKLQSSVNLTNIEWSTRLNKQKYDTTIFDDFYAMTLFDCLIRPDSSFTKVVQLLGNYSIIFYPIHATWDTDKLVIDRVGIIAHEQKPFLPI